MLDPFSGAYTGPDEPETPPVPEVVPNDSLGHDAIGAAEGETRAEENEWRATA